MIAWCVSCLQRGMYDWFALSLGLAASVRPASNTLAPFKPPQVLCKTKHYVLLVVTMAISFAMYWGCLAWLKAQPWFRESPGTSFQVSRCEAFFVVFLHWIGMSLFGCFWLCPLTCWSASHLHDAVLRQAKVAGSLHDRSLDAYVLRSCTGSLCGVVSIVNVASMHHPLRLHCKGGAATVHARRLMHFM